MGMINSIYNNKSTRKQYCAIIKFDVNKIQKLLSNLTRLITKNNINHSQNINLDGVTRNTMANSDIL